MNEIKCPECGSTISIDENSYSNILKQVRDQEFDDEMKKRLEILERDKQKSVDPVSYTHLTLPTIYSV